MMDNSNRISGAIFCASQVALVVTLYWAWVTPAVVDWLYMTSVWNAATVFLFQLAVMLTAATVGMAVKRLDRLRPIFRHVLLLAPSMVVTIPAAYFLLRKTDWATALPKSVLVPALVMTSILLTLLLSAWVHLVTERAKSEWSWTLLTSLSTLVLVAIRTSGILLPRPVDVPAPVPTVALVVADTLRADAVSGRDGRTTARAGNFQSFTRTGIECRNVYAASSWTPPSHAVLFTGTPFYSGNETTVGRENLTLAEEFKDAGYITVGVSANPLLRADNGFAQGFDLYLNLSENMVLQHNPFGAIFEWIRGLFTPRIYPRALEVTRATQKVLGRYAASPLFLFVNYMDAHDPYLPSQEAISQYPQLTAEDLPLGVLRRRGESISDFMKNDADRLTPWQIEKLEALYWACITDWDAGFAQLLKTLRRREHRGPSLIAVTSDHGEVFGENDGFFTHKNQLLLGEIEIPLVVGGTIVPLIERGTTFDGYLTHEEIHQLFVRIPDMTRLQSVEQILSEISLNCDPGSELVIVSAMGPTEVVRGLEDHRGKYADKSIILTYYPRNGAEIIFPDAGEPDWRSGGGEGTDGRVLLDSAFTLADIYRRRSPVFQGLKYQPNSQATEDALRSLGYIQ